jgi:hypothetical protein
MRTIPPVAAPGAADPAATGRQASPSPTVRGALGGASMRTPDALHRRAGLWWLLFVVAVQLPFATLTVLFDYPDVLRQPASRVLQAFVAGGDGLVLVWYAYAASIGAFVAGAWAFWQVTTHRASATVLALVSGLLQAVALLRWTFAVPSLAAAHAVASPAQQAVLEAQFALLNGYLGMGLGEHLGQVLMVAWTLVMTTRAPMLSRWWIGLSRLSAALLSVGLLEQLGTALGRDASLLAPLSTTGFLLWSAWLVALALRLVRTRGV